MLLWDLPKCIASDFYHWSSVVWSFLSQSQCKGSLHHLTSEGIQFAERNLSPRVEWMSNLLIHHYPLRFSLGRQKQHLQLQILALLHLTTFLSSPMAWWTTDKISWNISILLTFVMYESSLEPIFISLMATKSSPLWGINWKSRHPNCSPCTWASFTGW